MEQQRMKNFRIQQHEEKIKKEKEEEDHLDYLLKIQIEEEKRVAAEEINRNRNLGQPARMGQTYPAKLTQETSKK